MSRTPGGHHGLRYAAGLDGVRALAVFAEVAYHIGTTSGQHYTDKGSALYFQTLLPQLRAPHAARRAEIG